MPYVSATLTIFFINIALPEKTLQRNEVEVRPLFHPTSCLKLMKIRNCERFFLATHRLSIVKTSISSFPPYFRNLELNVLGNIFYHHSTIKYKRRLNISQKRRWRQSHRCQRRNLRRNHYGGRRQKSGCSKNKKAVKRKTSKKRSEVSMIRYWVLLSEWCNQN